MQAEAGRAGGMSDILLAGFGAALAVGLGAVAVEAVRTAARKRRERQDRRLRLVKRIRRQ